MDGSDGYSFSEIDYDSDSYESVNNTEIANNNSEIVYTDYRNCKPYYCGCDPLRKFKQLGHFRSHMKKHHNVVIPNKFKRKAEEANDDSTLKEFKQ